MKKLLLLLIFLIAILFISLLPTKSHTPIKGTVGYIDAHKVYESSKSYKIAQQEADDYEKRVNAELEKALKRPENLQLRKQMIANAQKRIKDYRDTLLQDVINDVDNAITDVANKQKIERVYVSGSEKTAAQKDYTDKVIAELNKSLVERLISPVMELFSAKQESKPIKPIVAEENNSALKTETNGKSNVLVSTENTEEKSEQKADKAKAEDKKTEAVANVQPKTESVKPKTEEKSVTADKKEEAEKQSPKVAEQKKEEKKVAEKSEPAVEKAAVNKAAKPEAATKPTVKAEEKQETARKTDKTEAEPKQNTGSKVTVQFSASVNKTGIQRMVASVRKKGIPAVMQEGPFKNGSKWWRARVIVDNETEAREIMGKLSALGYKSIIAK